MTKIRSARPGDFDAYCALVSEVDRLHSENEPLYFKDPGVPVRQREFFDGILADEAKALFAAEFDGRIAGFIHLETKPWGGIPILVAQDFAVVSDIVVTESMRRQGVSRALMAEGERWAKSRGLKELRLTVWKFNIGAVAHYEALGLRTAFQTMVKRLA